VARNKKRYSHRRGFDLSRSCRFIILLFIAIERRTATSRGLLLAFGFFAAVVAYSETKPGALPLIAIAGAINSPVNFAPASTNLATAD